MAGIIVLHAAPAAQETAVLEAWLEALPYAHGLVLQRRSPSDRDASVTGIALALTAAEQIGGRPVRAADLRFPEGGKPLLEGGPHFSVSHTAGLVACAASVDLDCGLDVERLPDGMSGDVETQARLRRWTAMEAVLKAAGLGLRQVDEVQLEEGGSALLRGCRYWLRAVDIGRSWVGHVAAASVIDAVRIEELPAVPPPPGPAAP